MSFLDSPHKPYAIVVGTSGAISLITIRANEWEAPRKLSHLTKTEWNSFTPITGH